MLIPLLACLASLTPTFAQEAAPVTAKIVAGPPTDSANPFYVCNRAPLLPSPFAKLPIGSITPMGWLRTQLVLESTGMTGRLEEISPWCKFEGNAWASPTGEGHSGWEELPYWLKGFGDLGYVLKDKALTDASRKWIEGVLSSQREDGWFGPRNLLTNLDGKPDLWPHMVMLNALQSYYEATGDQRVITLMTGYFRWQLNLPEEDFLAGFWPNVRAGDNIESVHWLYNRTGEAWLLQLVDKIQRRCAKWTDGVASWHGVNIGQSFRQPAMYYVQAKDPAYLDAAVRNYDEVIGTYGQVPGGGFGADENCRPDYTDPRQGTETCTWVELMHSFEMLTRITANPLWADRCEEIAFNSLPASMQADLKGLHYLTAPNQPQCDPANKAPGIQNGGNMFGYSPGACYRCCQHNVSHGWPYYAEELWLATADKGLCASLYAASQVSAKVGDGTDVRIEETTDYPFSEEITLTIHALRAVQFPLYLRIPKWCEGGQVQVNGQPISADAKPLSYLVLDRAWADGDKVTLRLPMRLTVRKWAKNRNAVSVDRGPLMYSLKIQEQWSKYGGTDEWPDLEVRPTCPWNYGLMLDGADPAASFEVVARSGPLAAQPFTLDAAPIELRAKAKRIPAWQMNAGGLANTLQDSPAKSDEPDEMVTLVPMGCARLRIASFPVIGDGPDAHEWVAPADLPQASHCFESDTTAALNDGLEPANSNDHNIPRMTWWPQQGTVEWVQYTYKAPRKVSSVEVYWFDDTGVGQCRVPKSWRVLALKGDAWEPVTGAGQYGVATDQYNKLTFDPVETKGLRIEVQLQDGSSGGILEWKVL